MASRVKSFRFDEDTFSILDQLAKLNKRKPNNMAEILILEAGEKAKLKPIKPEPVKKTKSQKP